MDDEDECMEECEDESEPIILRIDDTGTAHLHKPEDFVELKREDMDLIQGFIKENQESFNTYCENQKIIKKGNE